jgi:hypothetical protein
MRGSPGVLSGVAAPTPVLLLDDEVATSTAATPAGPVPVRRGRGR